MAFVGPSAASPGHGVAVAQPPPPAEGPPSLLPFLRIQNMRMIDGKPEYRNGLVSVVGLRLLVPALLSRAATGVSEHSSAAVPTFTVWVSLQARKRQVLSSSTTKSLSGSGCRKTTPHAMLRPQKGFGGTTTCSTVGGCRWGLAPSTRTTSHESSDPKLGGQVGDRAWTGGAAGALWFQRQASRSFPLSLAVLKRPSGRHV